MLENGRYECKRVNGGSKAGAVSQNPNDAAHQFPKHIKNYRKYVLIYLHIYLCSMYKYVECEIVNEVLYDHNKYLYICIQGE